MTGMPWLPDATPVIALLQHILETGSRWAETGDDPVIGCNCYGLVRFAFRETGITLPQDVWQAEAFFRHIEPPYQPWDIVLANFLPYQGARHLGLLLQPPYGYHMSPETNGLARFAVHQVLWRRVIAHRWRYQGFLCA